MTDARVALGAFDHLDKSGAPISEVYEARLRLAEKYDQAGFYAYHLAEHHGSPLGLAPSPGIFLAALAQRTKRLRFGPLVYTLPLYNPLRLIEEICMLDQISGGRLELGVGRGIVPYEVAFFGMTHLETPSMFEEALEVILKGLREPFLDHQGHHYRFHRVPMELEPHQQPHPPLWYGVSRPERAEWAARNRINIVCNSPAETASSVFDHYKATWAHEHRGIALPKLGMARHVFIANSDTEANARAQPAYEMWYASLSKLWRDNGAEPVNFAKTYDDAVSRGAVVAGSPSTVRETIARQCDISGANYFLCRFAFGDLTAAEAETSLDLFLNEVQPELMAEWST